MKKTIFQEYRISPPLRYCYISTRELHRTTTRLVKRICASFPDSGLSNIASQIDRLASQTASSVEKLAKPTHLLRILNYILRLTLALLVVMALIRLGFTFKANTLGEFIIVLEPALATIVLMAAFCVYCNGLESRIKGKRAVAELHQLRCLAHIIDMHQLTKDPSRIGTEAFTPQVSTTIASKPMSAAELTQYLDYCSELLSLLSKISALYAQHLQDEMTLEAVDRIEGLTLGLSRKIWQKIIIIHPSTQPRVQYSNPSNKNQQTDRIFL